MSEVLFTKVQDYITSREGVWLTTSDEIAQRAHQLGKRIKTGTERGGILPGQGKAFKCQPFTRRQMSLTGMARLLRMTAKTKNRG
ncbi:hypothetical protein ACFQEX_18525 [Roseibium salinum]|uniref:hypothetical protein n=1 Tax=Roseibium salinum TaxID=1604349 RepID=UPI0036073ECF